MSNGGLTWCRNARGNIFRSFFLFSYLLLHNNLPKCNDLQQQPWRTKTIYLLTVLSFGLSSTGPFLCWSCWSLTWLHSAGTQPGKQLGFSHAVSPCGLPSRGSDLLHVGSRTPKQKLPPFFRLRLGTGTASLCAESYWLQQSQGEIRVKGRELHKYQKV